MEYKMKTFCLITFTFLMTHLEAKQGIFPKDSTEEGIRFVRGLSWKKILKMAKEQNKYIFIDCFTTWCGPCKLMEKEVFAKKAVAEFYNQHFISVRCQMDKTEKDDETV